MDLPRTLSHQLPKFIAICGRKHAGKDVVARYLCDAHEYRHVKFATPLKNMLKDLFGFTDEEVEFSKKDVVHPVWHTTPRKLMQFLGTDVMQIELQEYIPWIGRSFWAHRLVNSLPPDAGRVVISDLRFLHEVQALQTASQGSCMVVRIVRPGVDLNDLHLSELEHLDIKADAEIENNGTLAELHAAVDEVLLKASAASQAPLRVQACSKR